MANRPDPGAGLFFGLLFSLILWLLLYGLGLLVQYVGNWLTHALGLL